MIPGAQRFTALPMPGAARRSAFKAVAFKVGTLCLFALLVLPMAVNAQTTPQAHIREDERWSGQITISHDVSIAGATVRVEPGSIIRFAAAGPGTTGPVIELRGPALGAGPPHKPTKLILAGTADQPILVETPPGLPPGAITADPMTGCSLVARHVVFRRLGTPVSPQRCQPAVFLVLTSPDDDLWITHCRFENTGPVHAEFIGAGATAEVSHCTFVNTVGDLSLVLIGTGDAMHVATDNVADASFRIECPQVLLRDNVLVGESAAIAVPVTAADGVTIDRNYVHCTTRVDNGRYALKCSTPQAVVSRNVLRGGTYVIESASATVTGNVIVGAAGLHAAFGIPGLDVDKLRSTTTTHYLIANLAPGALVADNLLLGPAYAAIAVGPPSLQVRIEHNLFDGWHLARRALQFNPLTAAKAEPLAAVVQRNVITRYQISPITDRAQQTGTLAKADHNLFADVPEALYEKTPDVPAKGPGDQRLDTFSQLLLAGPAATRFAAGLEDQLLRRQITVAEVRQAWLDAYRPRPGSPLATMEPDGPAGPRLDTQPAP